MNSGSRSRGSNCVFVRKWGQNCPRECDVDATCRCVIKIKLVSDVFGSRD